MAGKTIDIIKQKRKVPEAFRQRHKVAGEMDDLHEYYQYKLSEA
jgi:hypothetical protein